MASTPPTPGDDFDEAERWYDDHYIFEPRPMVVQVLDESPTCSACGRTLPAGTVAAVTPDSLLFYCAACIDVLREELRRVGDAR